MRIGCGPLLSAVCCILWFGALPLRAEGPLRIYIDADFTHAPDAGRAIELGVRAALHDAGGLIAGHPGEVVILDHRSSPKRSFANMQRVHRDPHGLAVFGGQQSPPYLSFGKEINRLGLPLLLAWSAAGPATRQSEAADNHIFRLSVDDTKAGPFLVQEALTLGCRRPAVLLVDTGWGRANERRILGSLSDNDVPAAFVTLFDPRFDDARATEIAESVVAAKADCAILVTTPVAANTLLPALADRTRGLRVVSHWGILGADLQGAVDHQVRQSLSLRMLVTCAFSPEAQNSPTLHAALAAARDLGTDAMSLGDIPASPGFVHGFDLARLLMAAAEQARADPDWRQGAAGKRAAVRRALEVLEQPVPGILRTYTAPFRPSAPDDPDAHEALGADDLCLATFDPQGQLASAQPGG